MSSSALGAVLAVVGLLVFVLAGPIVGQAAAMLVGVTLVLVGAALFLAPWGNRDL